MGGRTPITPSHRHVAGTPWPPKLAQMWLDPSFIRCRRGARNGTSGPWNGQRACAAKRRGRLQVDEVHSPRLPRRYRQGASPKWLLLRCQAGASLTSHASTGGGEGALARTSSVGKVSEDGQSTWACQASEAQSMIRSVHPSGNRAALRHTRRHWPLPSGSNAEYQVASWNIGLGRFY